MNQWIILAMGVVYVFLIILFVSLLIKQLLSGNSSTRLLRLYGEGGKKRSSWKGVVVSAGVLLVYSVLFWIVL